MAPFITDWQVEVMFYYENGDTEIFSTKQFNKTSELEIRELCKKNAPMLFEGHKSVDKIEFDINDIHKVDVGFKRNIFLKYFR